MTNRLLLKPEDTFSLLQEANRLRHKEDYSTAIDLYLSIGERFGEEADLMAVIAVCYFALAVGNPHETGENFGKAIHWIEKAIALEPNNARLHIDLAQYCSLGDIDYEKASQEYRRAIALAPNNVVALVGAASLYGVPEEVVTLDEATGWLEQAVRLAPNNPNYHFRLGKLYQESGRVADSRNEWLKALVGSQPLNLESAQTISP